MGILLSAHHLSKSFGPRPLFEDLSFGLSEGERTGLIGPNGSGKSTLLKILAGLETPDEGDVASRRGLRVRYLSQADVFAETSGATTVHEVLAHALRDGHLEDYEIDMRIESALEGSGFDPQQTISTLSGGWRKRLAILTQVITEPDLLLLDEPTNHLDLEGVLWLEKFLLGLRFSFLMVTHDRRFLETVCNRVIELNKRYAEGYFSSVGAYSDFVQNRENYFNVQQAREDSTRNTVRREIEWLSRGPKARTTKQKARIDRAGELIGELAELEYRNAQDKAATLGFTGSDRQTKKLVQATHIEKSMGGRKLFGPLDFILSPGSRLGLLGANGSGKSTLLKIIAGSLEPDAGTIKRANALRVITFDQHREQLDPDWPLRRALCESGEFVQYNGRAVHWAAWADRFLFSKDQIDQPIRKLSGGEQARVLIARLMLRPADVLLLDEPTNDLDIRSLEVLESSLADFPGALVLVTHDRYLLDRVSDEILALDGQGRTTFYADLFQWESSVGAEGSRPLREENNPPAPSAPKAKARRNLSAAEAKELRNVEAMIRTLEGDITRARKALEDPAIAANAGELMARQKVVTDLESQLSERLVRWEELQTITQP